MQRWAERPIASISLDNLLNAGKEAEFTPGAVIVRQGDTADCFYLLVEGRAEVFAGSIDPERREIVWRSIKQLDEGEIFGERALDGVDRAQAGVRAVTHCTVLAVDMSKAATVVEDLEALQRQLEFVARQRARRQRKLERE
jgi:CRP-like cAMP-binding protein